MPKEISSVYHSHTIEQNALVLEIIKQEKAEAFAHY